MLVTTSFPSGSATVFPIRLTEPLTVLPIKPTLHRYSGFDPPQPASTWLDPAAVVERARAAAAEGEELGEPVLTYRGNRDRLTWRVPMRNKAGAIYVAGDHAEESATT